MSTRMLNTGRNGWLGFPIWLPLLLGVALFWAGHLLAGERRAPRTKPAPHAPIAASKLIAV